MSRPRDFEPPLPSRDLAWMLGVTSGGGCVDKRQIMLTQSDSDLKLAFARIGSEVLQQNPSQNKDKTGYSPRFGGTRLASWMGDLRRESWPDTVRDKHSWIFADQEYIWGLIEGFYETRGFVAHLSFNPAIRFSTSYESVAGMLTDLLVRQGLRNPVVSRAGKDNRVTAVHITNIPDQLIFANNIHPKIPAKEAELAVVRQRTLDRAKAKTRTDEELLVEWVRIAGLLGHIPTSTKLRELSKDKKTPYSDKVYANRFGRNGNRNYSAVVKELTRHTGVDKA